MCGEVRKGKQGGPDAAAGQQREAQGNGCGPQGEVAPASDACAEADDDRALVAAGVFFAVAEIVDHQHRVDHQSAGQCRHEDLPGPCSGLDVVSESHGDQSEKEDDRNVAQSVVSQRPGSCGVEIGEEDAGGACGDEFPASVAEDAGVERPDEQSDARGAGRQREARNACLHGREGDVSFGEGAVGPQPVGFVRPFQKIPEVVDQVGRALHQHGEHEAQHGWQPVERMVGIGQCGADQNEDDRVAEAVRPYSQNPGG